MKRHVKRPAKSLSCTGKNVYAKDEAADMARYRESVDGSLMDAYRCAFGCTKDGQPGWHIGHAIRTKRSR